MNLCSNGHNEVCFEGRTCPVCELADEKRDEIKSLQYEIEKLEREVQGLKDEILELGEE